MSVCNVGVLRPNGWWIKIKLGTEVGLDPGHTMLLCYTTLKGRTFLRKLVEPIYLLEAILFIGVEKSTLGYRHILRFKIEYFYVGLQVHFEG